VLHFQLAYTVTDVRYSLTVFKILSCLKILFVKRKRVQNLNLKMLHSHIPYHLILPLLNRQERKSLEK